MDNLNVVGELQLCLALLLATIASYVYKNKKRNEAVFNKLTPVEKKIEIYVQEHADLEGWNLR